MGVERVSKRKCVAVYLGRLREQQKRKCGSILGEIKRAAKRKYVAEYLGRLREQQKESVWQYTSGG